MEFLIDLAVILITAKLFGEFFERMRMPELLGAIVAGFLLSSVLGIVDAQNIASFGQIGLILLLFIAGFKEVNTEQIMRNKKSSILTGLLGSLFPLGAGYALGIFFGFTSITSLFIGVALAATSISISLGAFIEAGKLNTRLGRTILGASVVDDIVGLFLLTIVVAIATTGGMTLKTIIDIFFGMGLFAVIFLISSYVFPLLVNYSKKFEADESQFTVTIVLVIILAFMAEKLGLSTVLGAFLAGIILSKVPQLETKNFFGKLNVVSDGLFVPLFFAWVGTQIIVDPTAISMFTGSLIILALLAKIIPSFIVGKICKFTNHESIALGLGMIPRGEVAMIILMVGKAVNAVPDSIFSSFLILIFVTVFLTPILLNPYLKKKLHA